MLSPKIMPGLFFFTHCIQNDIVKEIQEADIAEDAL